MPPLKGVLTLWLVYQLGFQRVARPVTVNYGPGKVVMMCSWSSLYSCSASTHLELHSHMGGVELLTCKCFADLYPVMKLYSI